MAYEPQAFDVRAEFVNHSTPKYTPRIQSKNFPPRMKMPLMIFHLGPMPGLAI